MAEGIAPKPVKLGPRSVAWIEDELEVWMRELETKRERSRHDRQQAVRIKLRQFRRIDTIRLHRFPAAPWNT